MNISLQCFFFLYIYTKILFRIDMKVPQIIQTFTSFEFVIALVLKIREKREAECQSVKKEKDFLSSIARSPLDATMKTTEKWAT